MAAVGVVCLGSAAFGQKVSAVNPGANQVTLQLSSTATGTGYFTLLAGTSTKCGTAK